jgi:hypothetical protein
MDNRANKIRSWILGSFQFITLGMLTFCIFLLINQQREIKNLKSDVRSIENNCDTYQIESKLDDIKNKLDYVESNLSSEIDDVRSAVIIWSN